MKVSIAADQARRQKRHYISLKQKDFIMVFFLPVKFALKTGRKNRDELRRTASAEFLLAII